MRKICAVMTCRWRKQEARGGNSQEPVLTPDYTQCTTRARTLTSCLAASEGAWGQEQLTKAAARCFWGLQRANERLLQNGDSGRSTHPSSFFQLPLPTNLQANSLSTHSKWGGFLDYIFIYLCGSHVDGRGQLVKVSSFLPPSDSWGLNSGCQAW